LPYVKNMSKDGAYYWVFANVTPSFDANGQVEGYFSVRRKPKAQAVQVVADLYRQMLDAERRAGSEGRMRCVFGIAYWFTGSKGE
jgi:hypothetical protein